MAEQIPTQYRRFCLWKLRPSKFRPGKYDKIPINPYGSAINPHDPANLISYAEAMEGWKHRLGDGVAYILSEEDPFFFFDIDGAIDSAGNWSRFALEACEFFRGCFMEISSSGKGIHIIGTVPAAGIPHGCRSPVADAELYTKKRFVALTFNRVTGSFFHQVSPEKYYYLVNSFFPPTTEITRADWTTEPAPEWAGPVDDDELITRMLRSRKSPFSTKASVQALWTADTDELAQVFPDSTGGKAFDHNRADAALCAHLAFWTGKDCERIDRLFRKSALYREKWELRDDYRQNTITLEVGRCANVYQEKKTPSVDVGDIKVGNQYKTVYDQQEFFHGCTYVMNDHRVLTPEGLLLKPDQFRVVYGGYTFATDSHNGKSTRSAWEAFTESQGYKCPKADYTCFRPDFPPGHITKAEGLTLVNRYVPIETPQTPGNITPFIDFLCRLLPDETDRAILLAYIAALIQYPGVKFQWAPVLQGIKGNGKTLIIRVLTHAVGERYTHLPNALDLTNKFNAWLEGKLFIGIEEIQVGNKLELMEALKPLITNDRIEIQRKGKDQFTTDNRANFLLTTNFKGGVRKTWDERRYAVFFTAQQAYEDLQRFGMGGNYFPDLYDWLRACGYSIINYWLRRYEIPDQLNPATHCHRAPVTSTTAAAIQESLGLIEQEILEAIGQNRHGFAGGWISSMQLDAFLQEKHLRLPQSKKREILESLGYIYHPALTEGRTTAIIHDGDKSGRPRLYVQQGHILENITKPADVAARYIADQLKASEIFKENEGRITNF